MKTVLLNLLFLVPLVSTSAAGTYPKEIARCIPKQELSAYDFPFAEEFRERWVQFYCSSSEYDRVKTLVRSGNGIVPSIIEAVPDKKMFARRYAIAALGYLGDIKAIPVLEGILADASEKEYFRGDALEAIFLLDEHLGTTRAKEVLKAKPGGPEDFLLKIAQRIVEKPETIDRALVDYGPGGVSFPSK